MASRQALRIDLLLLQSGICYSNDAHQPLWADTYRSRSKAESWDADLFPLPVRAGGIDFRSARHADIVVE